MTKLHGFAVSNYYNMVKFALLEKGAKFEEVAAMPSQENDYKAESPMGKVPCLETDKGFLSETNVILEYIEASHASPALLPADAFAAAKVREVMKVVSSTSSCRRAGITVNCSSARRAARPLNEASRSAGKRRQRLEGAVFVQALPVWQLQLG